MVDYINPISWSLALVQTVLFISTAPLFVNWVNRIKCYLQNRKPPGLLQPYRDLRRLLTKQLVLSHTASPLFRIVPYIVFGTSLIAASVVPFIIAQVPAAAMADAIVLVGILALGRFFIALAGMDVGTSFGGMGSSREMTIVALAEPAMLIVVFTMAMVAESTNLSTIIVHTLDSPLALRPSLLFAFTALVLVGIAETGRIPIDNPTTHLELTMIHEAMLLEYSGRHLALMEYAAQIKLMIYAVLIANLFIPWGIATDLTFQNISIAVIAITFKLALLGTLLAVGETAVAKMRIFRVPTFLAVAFTIALVGMLSAIILETGL